MKDTIKAMDDIIELLCYLFGPYMFAVFLIITSPVWVIPYLAYKKIR